jgi:hypothetical protein
MNTEADKEFGLTPLVEPASGDKTGRKYPVTQDKVVESHPYIVEEESTGRRFRTDDLGLKKYVGKGYRRVE